MYLMVIILSPFLSFCLSTSMCAPVTSWIAVMLQPPRPMIRDTTEAGTESFLDLGAVDTHHVRTHKIKIDEHTDCYTYTSHPPSPRCVKSNIHTGSPTPVQEAVHPYRKLYIHTGSLMSQGASTGTHLRTTSFQPSSLRWPLLGLVRLGLLLGEHPGRAMALSWAASMLGGRSLSMSWSLGEAECNTHGFTHTHSI